MDIYDAVSDKAIKGLKVTDVNRALQFCIHVYLNLRLQSLWGSTDSPCSTICLSLNLILKTDGCLSSFVFL